MAAPIYRKIKELILQEITEKSVNSPIDSEREMAMRFGASRMTVRNAINELVEEGFLYRDKNKGTFVADRKLLKKNTSADTLQRSDATDYTIIYFNCRPANEFAHYLEMPEKDLMLMVSCLNKKNNRPESVEEYYFARGSVSDAEINDLRKLLELDKYLNDGTVIQKFIPMIVPAQYANLLHLKIDVPIIMVDTLIRSKAGKSMVYMRTYNNPSEKVIEIIS